MKGDSKSVTIKHYDQLGRLRLTRTLENAATQSPTNETHGIKVQSRYKIANSYSYSVTSTPYRAATSGAAGNEPTMGWTRSKGWNTGRRSETESFTGAAIPVPWGSNSATTGKVITETDAEAITETGQTGKKRRSITNAFGQLTRADEPNASGNLGTKTSPVQPTNYTYDTLGNLISTNQGVQTRAFTYDSLSRLKTAADPESGTKVYTYDSNGNLLTKKDARNVTTSHIYDQLNRIKTRSYTDGTPAVTYTYDNLPYSNGKVTKVSSSVSTSEFLAFDNMGKVLSHRQTTDGNIYNTSYSYNLGGALLETTYPSGRKVKNTIDVDGDLSKIESKTATGAYQVRADDISYTPHKGVDSLKMGNNRWESVQFNGRLQPTRIALGTSQNAANVLKLDFNYGTTVNNGNLLSQTITTPAGSGASAFTAVQSYTYDSLNRVKDAKELVGSSQKWKQVFTYDRYGNRRFGTGTTTITSCATNTCNPTISASNNRFNSGQGYTYDLSGNVIADAEGRTLLFDGENKQKQVKNSSNQVIGTYYYDGDGRRIKKITSSEQRIFVYDAGGELIAEYSSLVPQSTPVTKYITNDHLGSPRIVTDQTGAVKSRRDFMPFGEEAFIGVGNRLVGHGYTYGDSISQKFTGYQRDEETNLDFAQARMYSSQLGRFTAVDPINITSGRLADPQRINLYAYARNNPLKIVDRSGEDVIIAIGAEQVGTRTINIVDASGDMPTKMEVPVYKMTVSDDVTGEVSEYLITRDAPMYDGKEPWKPNIIYQIFNFETEYRANNTAFEPKGEAGDVVEFGVVPLTYPAGTDLEAYALRAKDGTENLPAQRNEHADRDDPEIATGIMVHVGGVYEKLNGEKKLAGSKGCMGVCPADKSAKTSNAHQKKFMNDVVGRQKKDGGAIKVRITIRKDVVKSWQVAKGYVTENR